MDFRVFTAAFISIALAELADKTQLIGLSLSARTSRPFSVWVGSVSAYMIVTAVTVIVGAMLSRFIRPELIRFGGAFIVITIGLLMLWGKL